MVERCTYRWRWGIDERMADWRRCFKAAGSWYGRRCQIMARLLYEISSNSVRLGALWMMVLW